MERKGGKEGEGERERTGQETLNAPSSWNQSRGRAPASASSALTQVFGRAVSTISHFHPGRNSLEHVGRGWFAVIPAPADVFPLIEIIPRAESKQVYGSARLIRPVDIIYDRSTWDKRRPTGRRERGRAFAAERV